ncbi:UNVERIFIED_CONTAM: hypothetical protein H355_016943, partial [Colinus virginianus]
MEMMMKETEMTEVMMMMKETEMMMMKEMEMMEVMMMKETEMMMMKEAEMMEVMMMMKETEMMMKETEMMEVMMMMKETEMMMKETEMMEVMMMMKETEMMMKETEMMEVMMMMKETEMMMKETEMMEVMMMMKETEMMMKETEMMELYRTADTERGTAEFPLVSVIRDDAVTYRCQYAVLGSGQMSELSDPVELVAIDHGYPKPGISLSPAGRVGSGSNVTIRCQGRDYGGPAFLHKDGSSAPIQHRDPDVGGTAVFTLFGVTPADGGTYRCSYRIGGCCFLSSPLGDNVTLEVVPQGGCEPHARSPVGHRAPP